MLVKATYADVFEPCAKKWAQVYNVVLIVGGSLLIGLSAQIAVMLPFSPVPVTGQTFAVLMIAALLGSKRGSLSVLAYLSLGAVGLPVFAMGGSSLPYTAGYLAGFVAAAYGVGFLAERGWDRRIGTTIVAMLLGNVIIYAFGLFWLFCLMGINKAVLVLGLYPFIAGDCLKTVLAAAILPAGWKLLKMMKIPVD